MWTEQPLITYKKQEVTEDLEIYVDYLHQVFRELDQTAQDKLMAMYGPEEGREGLKWKLYRWICLEIVFPSVCVIISFEECSLRICSANEVGGQNNENSVYELYCRLNHSCCNNVVGQVVPHSEGGQAYQVGKHKYKDKDNEQDKMDDNAVGQVVPHSEGGHCQAYQVGK